MTILEFACLRGGFTPAELGLPPDELRNARSRPLKRIKQRYDSPLYRCAFNKGPAYQKLPAKKNRRTSPHKKPPGGESLKSVLHVERLSPIEAPKHIFRTSEITPRESERSGIWEGGQVRLAEAHALQMRGGAK